MTIEIYSADSVWSITNAEGFSVLDDLLSYPAVFWRPGPYGRKQKETYQKHLIQRGRNKSEYIFLTGLIPRALNFLDSQGMDYKYTSDVPSVEFDEPGVDGIEFRDYQENIIELALEESRGVIKAVTASGKAFMILGIISAFTQENILLLVHTKDLVNQLVDDLEKFKFGPIGVYSGGKKTIERITVATIQSYKKIALDHIEHWDVVIIDEVHHVQNLDSANYGYVLQRLSAPIKLGFTATLPEEKGGKFALEALVGPVICDYSMAKASSDGILAIPKIYVLETQFQCEVSKLSDYKQVYQYGIALNHHRNQQIVDNAIALMKQGRTILILISRIIHGEELVKAFAYYGYQIDFIRGATKKDQRTQLKEALKTKKIKWLIASVIFTEGVDIPAMDCLINASGGKSEVAVLQKIGRGLRKTDEKEDVLIIDFADTSHRYLRNHYTQRIRIYKENNWKTTLIALPEEE